MKAAELRIGNLVNWDEHIFPISQINSSGFYDVRAFNNIIQGVIGDDKISPIPITEEWLLKFEFRLIPTDKNRHYVLSYSEGYLIHLFPAFTPDFKNKIGIIYLEGEWQLALSDRVTITDYIPRCTLKYVHQLQNLYFALTGEELELKK